MKNAYKLLVGKREGMWSFERLHVDRRLLLNGWTLISFQPLILVTMIQSVSLGIWHCGCVRVVVVSGLFCFFRGQLSVMLYTVFCLDVWSVFTFYFITNCFVVSCAQMANTKKSASNEGGDKGAVVIAIYVYVYVYVYIFIYTQTYIHTYIHM